MTNKTMLRLGSPFTRWLFVLFFSIFCGCLPGVARAHETLTNAGDVLALPAKTALSGIPILVKGIVTAAETNWNGRFFVQDASGGIFVQILTNRQPVPGDVVQVWGVSSPGSYAPVISKPHWQKLGTAALPVAKPITIERLMSGAEDSQRVEVSGIVRTAQSIGNRVGAEIASGGYRFRAFFPPSPELDPQSLVGAKIKLRGTAAAQFNAPLRHFITVTIFVPRAADVIVEEPAPANPFDQPTIPLNGIAQYHKDRSPGNQVRVKGMVTYQRKGEDLFLQDETGGLQVKSKLPESFSPGEVVEAVGFPAVENYLPVLEDAVIRRLKEPRTNLEPKTATVAELQKGLHHADFITLRGRLIDRLVTGNEENKDNPVIHTTLVLQDTNFMFVAERDTSKANSFLTAIPIGSWVEVSGICLLESGDDGKIKSFHLLLPTSYDVQVIKKPSWLTPQHLLVSLMLVFVVLLIAIGWTLMVTNKNSLLKSLVREKESAQQGLQQAHDQLEERVKERTAQLKVEMTVRKESELQFRAVLTERARLAQELHDTLEQTMTGIALQQDLVADQLDASPGNASHHLKLARSLMKQGQLDLRRSVWGLRIRAEEQFNLANALITSVRQICGDTGIRAEVETIGKVVPLSDIIEENLLRIGQEAVTNVVKYSNANAVKVELSFGPREVVLHIVDNGNGFDPETCPGPKDGHFGILGIRERTERLGGQVQITSTAGTGTSVRVEIPTNTQIDDQPLQTLIENHEERF